MDLRLSCSLWVHGSRTSALMSYDDPCNCGQHIPVCLRVARACSPSALASSACADALHMGLGFGFWGTVGGASCTCKRRVGFRVYGTVGHGWFRV